MNALVGGEPLLSLAEVEHEMRARDRQLDNSFSKDMQITVIRGARAYLGDKLIRTAKPHKLLDPDAGPLIAVRLNILTRKTLGGLQTDLDSRVLAADGQPVPGLYAAGEVAGFGGGGVHGYSALEGTFLGGVSSRVAPPGRPPQKLSGDANGYCRDVVCNNSVKMSAHHLPDDTAIARSAHGLQQMRSRRRRSPAGLEPARHLDASRRRSADQADMTARATGRDRRTAAVKQIGILPHLRALLDTTPPAN